jgi:hypothetical protein
MKISLTRTFAALLAFAGILNSAIAIEPASWEFTVAAGEHDRVGTPVRVALEVPAELRSSKSAVLQGSDDAIPCQLTAAGLQAKGDAAATRELHFVLPSLKAGSSTTLRLTIGGEQAKSAESSAAGKESFAWTDGKPGETELTFAGQGVLRYVHPKLDESDAKIREATYKPFHHVYAPDGSRVVTKGPGGQFTHHRGLYFGFNRITYGDDQKCDVWHCKAPAYQAHEKIVAKEEGFVVGRQQVQIGWHGAKGERFADEQRELTVYNSEPGQYIEFASTVSTPDKPIRLDGDPQHAGFHFRADNEVAEKTKSQTYYIRPDGQDKPGATRNWDAKSRNPKAVNEPWKVLSFVLGGKRYSALYLDHPSNPKEARSSERDYGRFGSYFEYDVTSDKPLKVRYRLILKDGEFTAEDAARLSADFVSPPSVAVRKP